jgi:hypothetical protein
MFGNSKPAASLSSGLLARKGQARPAMRPQGFLQMNPAAAQDDLGWNDMGEDFPQAVPYVAAVEEPIEAPKPEVLRQIESLDEQLAPQAQPEFEPETVAEVQPEPEPVVQVHFEPEPVAEVQPEPVAEFQPEPVVQAAPLAAPRHRPVKRAAAPIVHETAAKLKAAFTLRLDHDRHLRLRLASALTRRSSQQLVTQALDQFLESLDGIDALARQVDAADQG